MAHALAALMALCAPLIHPLTLRALIEVESATNPYAVSINAPNAWQSTGRALPAFDQPRDQSTALRLVASLHRLGYTTSVGLAQINTLHADHRGLNYVALFNPCQNLQLAQRVLLDCRRQLTHSVGQSPPLTQILSCYNSGNATSGLSNGYVAHIRQTATRIAVPNTANAIPRSPIP